MFLKRGEELSRGGILQTMKLKKTKEANPTQGKNSRASSLKEEKPLQAVVVPPGEGEGTARGGPAGSAHPAAGALFPAASRSNRSLPPTPRYRLLPENA